MVKGNQNQMGFLIFSPKVVCVQVCTGAEAHVWRPEGSFVESALCCHLYVSSRHDM